MPRKLFAPKPSLPETIALGATAGAVAANLMTVLRMFARRAGLIDKTVPQAMEEWMLDRLGTDLPGGPVAHHVLDQVLHMGYASGVGALDGYLQHHRIGNPYLRGVVVGGSTWAFAGLVLLPSLGASKGMWKAGKRENLVNLAAHLVFGVATAILTEEFQHQTARGPARERERRLAKVG